MVRDAAIPSYLIFVHLAFRRLPLCRESTRLPRWSCALPAGEVVVCVASWRFLLETHRTTSATASTRTARLSATCPIPSHWACASPPLGAALTAPAGAAVPPRGNGRVAHAQWRTPNLLQVRPTSRTAPRRAAAPVMPSECARNHTWESLPAASRRRGGAPARRSRGRRRRRRRLLFRPNSTRSMPFQALPTKIPVCRGDIGTRCNQDLCNPTATSQMAAPRSPCAILAATSLTGHPSVLDKSYVRTKQAL